MLWKYFAWMCSALCVGELSAAPGLGARGGDGGGGVGVEGREGGEGRRRGGRWGGG